MTRTHEVQRQSFSSFWVLLPMFALLGLGAACGDGSSVGPPATEASAIAAAVAPTEGGSSCLGDYADDLCRLLTEERVRSHFPEMPADAEQSSRTSGFTMCLYSWPGPRTGSREIMGQVIEYPIDDQVAIQWLRVLEVDDPLARFRNSYRTPTPEEEAKMAEAFRKALAEKVEEGELSEEGGEMGETMGSSLLGGLQFAAVEGVGTAAAWGGTGGQASLKVLDLDTELEVVVNVYGEETRNREAAIALAQEILAVCD